MLNRAFGIVYHSEHCIGGSSTAALCYDRNCYIVAVLLRSIPTDVLFILSFTFASLIDFVCMDVPPAPIPPDVVFQLSSRLEKPVCVASFHGDIAVRRETCSGAV